MDKKGEGNGVIADLRATADRLRARVVELEDENVQMKGDVAKREDVSVEEMWKTFAEAFAPGASRSNARIRFEIWVRHREAEAVRKLRDALFQLVRQVDLSNAEDDHGHRLQNLQAMAVARALTGTGGSMRKADFDASVPHVHEQSTPPLDLGALEAKLPKLGHFIAAREGLAAVKNFISDLGEIAPALEQQSALLREALGIIKEELRFSPQCDAYLQILARVENWEGKHETI